MHRDEDKERNPQEAMDLIDAVVRDACHECNDGILAGEGKEEGDAGEAKVACAVRIELEIDIGCKKYGEDGEENEGEKGGTGNEVDD
jgi:hypothetical protein